MAGPLVEAGILDRGGRLLADRLGELEIGLGEHLAGHGDRTP